MRAQGQADPPYCVPTATYGLTQNRFACTGGSFEPLKEGRWGGGLEKGLS